MKISVIAAGFAAAMALGAPASAALIEFDVSGLYMSKDSGEVYAPTGTFRWDNASFTISDVNVTSPFSTYTSGLYDSTAEEFTLFGSGSSGATELAISVFGTWFNDLESGAPGDTFFFGADPREADPARSGWPGAGAAARGPAASGSRARRACVLQETREGLISPRPECEKAALRGGLCSFAKALLRRCRQAPP